MTRDPDNLTEILNNVSLLAVSKSDAWTIALLMCKEKSDSKITIDPDAGRSKNAGYSIYEISEIREDVGDVGKTIAFVSDLNTRLEVNFPDGCSKNIWINKTER